MKRTVVLLLILLLALAPAAAKGKKLGRFGKQLLTMPGVTSVERIDSKRFKERYIITFTQPIDHNNPDMGTFSQRVVLGHVHPDSIMVVVTEGYSSTYTEGPQYREELSDIFNANSVVIEHRYFNQSCPAGLDHDQYWDYLTTEQAAADHHQVVMALKTLYHGKYIATGVSKGGITANLYRAYYPKDVDITVPYVAPFCNGPEDPAMGEAIGKLGTQDQQAHLQGFVKKVLECRSTLVPMLREYLDSAKIEMRIGEDELFELMALDLEVAIHARGDYKLLPDPDHDSPEAVFRALVRYGDPTGFSPTYDNMPYYVQAARELGHYSYNIERYRELLKYHDTSDYLRRTALPDNFHYEYTPETREMDLNFLNHTDAHMLFIYGANDPWYTVGVEPYVSNPNIYFFVHPYNCHRSKIRNFPEEMRAKIMLVLRKWLSEPVEK